MSGRTNTDTLDPAEIARYSRHLTLPDVGVDGQRALRDASVLIVGAGGLGSPLALYLAAAGVGRLGLVDFDRVELSNLQRQVLFDTAQVGRSKVECAARRVAALNPLVRVEAHAVRLDAGNAPGLVADYDIVADGTDNFPTRYLINDACVLGGKPLVYGSIFRFEGQVSVFHSPTTAGSSGPCYRCLYPEPPDPGSVPNCAEGGVLGVLPGIIGTLQATEVLKLILGRGESLAGRLLLFDALELRFRELKLRRDPACPVCGDRPTIRELAPGAEACAQPPPGAPAAVRAIDVSALKARMDRGERLSLLDVRTPEEWRICRLDGATLIPLSELPGRLGELNADDEVLVYCRSGVRSAQAVRFLEAQGFSRATNVTGGLHAWSDTIDPSVPRY